MKVRIGCNTLYPDGRLPNEAAFNLDCHRRALDLIAEAGFHAVEFSHGGALPADELVRAAEHARSLGLEPWSFHAWSALAADLAQVDPVVARYRHAAQVARALGVRVVVVHSGGNGRLEERKRANTETLAALAGMVGPDTAVAVENGKTLAEWEFIIQMVADCPAPNVGLNVDTGHANLGDLGVVRAIQMAGPRIRTTHLQDNLGERDDHLPPGEGRIDFAAALSAFKAAGYAGVYMVEISDCPPGREPNAVEDTRTAARNLRRLLAQAGLEASAG